MKNNYRFSVTSGDFVLEFDSVAAAFAFLGLPERKCYSFHTKLKKEKSLEFIWDSKTYILKIV